MKIVIEIPEETYNAIRNIRQITERELNAILNGTPLPKGHGDLIDRNDLLKWSYKIDSKYYMYDEVVDVDDIKNAPAIIEADGGGNDAVSD